MSRSILTKLLVGHVNSSCHNYSAPKYLHSCLIFAGKQLSLTRPTFGAIQTKRPYKTATAKRIANKQLANDSSWSIIAYNLSEELRIENIHRLLDNFTEYKVEALPVDVQNEAIMLSLKNAHSEYSNQKAAPAHNKQLATHDIFLFREGSIVFWGVPYEQQKRILYGLSPLKVDPHSSDMIHQEQEHLTYKLSKSIDKSRISRDVVELAIQQDQSEVNLDKFAFSHAVSQSVKLGIWEAILDKYIESIGWVTSDMKAGKSLNLTKDQVFRKTGEIYELKHNINLSSDLLDLPDIYWDRYNHEVIYLSVISHLNIRRRTAVINEKLNNCCELMNLLATHMNDRHHIRLEWMIIVLITVEVLFEIIKFF